MAGGEEPNAFDCPLKPPAPLYPASFGPVALTSKLPLGVAVAVSFE